MWLKIYRLYENLKKNNINYIDYTKKTFLIILETKNGEMYNVKFPQGCPWLIFRYNMVQEGEIIVFF